MSSQKFVRALLAQMSRRDVLMTLPLVISKRLLHPVWVTRTFEIPFLVIWNASVEDVNRDFLVDNFSDFRVTKDFFVLSSRGFGFTQSLSKRSRHPSIHRSSV